MKIKVVSTDIHLLNLRTRMPFRYGIASLTVVPHLFLRVELDIDGNRARGLAADNLPPKWFTKNPDASFEQEIGDMLRVIQAACSIAKEAGPAPSIFDMWESIYTGQRDWAAGENYPPLLWCFGPTLVERAMIDAFCRGAGTTFARAVHDNTLGIRLGDIHAGLAECAPADLLPKQPLGSIIARHTVGLSDPLIDEDIPSDERLNDGLPQSLAACIREYGLTHFKIKLCGDVDRDQDRLKRLAGIISDNAGGDFALTLDGNEQYKELETFRELWEDLCRETRTAAFLRHLLFAEQPIHRDAALGPAVRDAFRHWPDRPPIIIDESDASLGSLPEALDCGYVGTSHKNCKGVFKGIANASLIAHLQKRQRVAGYVMSGEDLTNLGPVALPQDMAVLATLGIEHAERNGHHYFTGLAFLPDDLQRQMLADHGDMYHRHDTGFPTLRIVKGRVDIGSTVRAPFGMPAELDPALFTPVEEWHFVSLDA